jgi:DNA repair protein RadC
MPIRLKLLARESSDPFGRPMPRPSQVRLADVEVLARTLSGTDERRQRLAQALLEEYRSVWELVRTPALLLRGLGLSSDEAERLRACIELGRRAVVEPLAGDSVREPHDAYRAVAAELAGAERERFVVVALDVKNRPRHLAVVAEGAVDACPIDPREVFAVALRERASSILLAHNHPSGDPTPSREDVQLTERLVAAGAVLGIPVLDHVIVGRPATEQSDCYVSLAERGLLPAPARAPR